MLRKDLQVHTVIHHFYPSSILCLPMLQQWNDAHLLQSQSRAFHLIQEYEWAWKRYLYVRYLTIHGYLVPMRRLDLYHLSKMNDGFHKRCLLPYEHGSSRFSMPAHSYYEFLTFCQFFHFQDLPNHRLHHQWSKLRYDVNHSQFSKHKSYSTC
jgi:hypothetical protein